MPCDPATRRSTTSRATALTAPLRRATTVTIEGVVTADTRAPARLRGFYLQEPTATATPTTSRRRLRLLRRPDPQSVERSPAGERVRLTGRVSEFNTTTEIDFVSDRPWSATPEVRSRHRTSSLPETVRRRPRAASRACSSTFGPTATLDRAAELLPRSLRPGHAGVRRAALRSRRTSSRPVRRRCAEADLNNRRAHRPRRRQQARTPTPIPVPRSRGQHAARPVTTPNDVVGVVDFGPVNSNDVHPGLPAPRARRQPTFTERQPAPAAAGARRWQRPGRQLQRPELLQHLRPAWASARRGAEAPDNQARVRLASRPKIVRRWRASTPTSSASWRSRTTATARQRHRRPGRARSTPRSAPARTRATSTTTGSRRDGTDAIKVGDDLQAGRRSVPVGRPWCSTPDVRPYSSGPRPSAATVPRAQAFQDTESGQRRRRVNHFKSKGSGCATTFAGGRPGHRRRAGQLQPTRVARPSELQTGWRPTRRTGGDDRTSLVIGDLNSYAQEDPIRCTRVGGRLHQLDRQFVGDEAYSYVFDGMSGYLDHALATPSLAAQMTGVTEWHINADEPSVLDYNTEFKTRPGHGLYSPDPYRSSDHDPVVLGAELGTSSASSRTRRRTRTLLDDCETEQHGRGSRRLDPGRRRPLHHGNDPGRRAAHFVGAVVANGGRSRARQGPHRHGLPAWPTSATTAPTSGPAPRHPAQRCRRHRDRHDASPGSGRQEADARRATRSRCATRRSPRPVQM